jgi:uncharacterized OsmC-like protein
MTAPGDTPLTVQKATGRAREGLAVDVNVGDATVRSDMPAARGGGGTGPAPGNLMRASIVACLTVGYRQWGQRLGVPLTDLEIDLQTEIDMRGQNGADGILPGWHTLRWHVRVTSPASPEDVERVLVQAERLSPMLDCLHPRITRTRTFELAGTEPG